MDTLDGIGSYLNDVGLHVDTIPRQPIQDVVGAMLTAYAYDRTIYIIGSAGSAATASHFATNLIRRTLSPTRSPIRAQSLCDGAALLTSIADEYGYAELFTPQLRSLLRRGDVVIAISSGGYAQHLLAALRYAGKVGAITIGLTGRDGDAFMRLTDHCVMMPSDNEEYVDILLLLTCQIITSVVCAAAPTGRPRSDAPILEQ